MYLYMNIYTYTNSDNFWKFIHHLVMFFLCSFYFFTEHCPARQQWNMQTILLNVFLSPIEMESFISWKLKFSCDFFLPITLFSKSNDKILICLFLLFTKQLGKELTRMLESVNQSLWWSILIRWRWEGVKKPNSSIELDVDVWHFDPFDLASNQKHFPHKINLHVLDVNGGKFCTFIAINSIESYWIRDLVFMIFKTKVIHWYMIPISLCRSKKFEAWYMTIVTIKP